MENYINEDKSIRLYNGDCLDVMDKMIEKGLKVDAIITDPPYGTMNNANLDGWKGNKTKWDKIIKIDDMFIKCEKLLRENGNLLLFGQEPFTSTLISNQNSNLPFSYRMIWLKDHFANALISKKAPVNYYEDIILFNRKYDTYNENELRKYFETLKNDIGITKRDIINKIGQSADHVFRTDSKQFKLCTEATYNKMINILKINELGCFKPYKELKSINEKYLKIFNLYGEPKKSNILNYRKDYTKLHPTQKPVALMEDLIKTYTNEGDIVLDFTMGSGTTGVACNHLNRKFIGIELDEKYFNIAKERIINESK